MSVLPIGLNYCKRCDEVANVMRGEDYTLCGDCYSKWSKWDKQKMGPKSPPTFLESIKMWIKENQIKNSIHIWKAE